MTYDTLLKDLLTKQENQIKAFERHRADMLRAVQATEKEILQQYLCTYSDAPPHVLNIISLLREDYNRNWSSDGLLINELMRRQEGAQHGFGAGPERPDRHRAQDRTEIVATAADDQHHEDLEGEDRQQVLRADEAHETGVKRT